MGSVDIDTAAAITTSRPRVEGDRERQILDGALEVLVEVGYDRLTFDTVAAHVHASKATLYRRWSTKAELVVSAVGASACMASSQVLPDTGALRSDLMVMFAGEDDLPIHVGQIIAALMPAVHRDADLTQVFQERVLAPKTQALRTLIGRAQRRGEVGPGADLDLLVAIIPAFTMHLMITTGSCPGPAQMRSIVDHILLPACLTGHGPTARA